MARSNQTLRGPNLINSLLQAFRKLQQFCDQAWVATGEMETDFVIFANEFDAAANQIEKLCPNGLWIDDTARDDTVALLKLGSMLLGNSDFKSQRREIDYLVSALQADAVEKQAALFI